MLGAAATALSLPRHGFAAPVPAPGNFRYVYADERLRDAFRDFLVNVFHLYPEDSLHALIGQLADRLTLDEEIYLELQGQLDDLSPFLADLRFALPALGKQKREMGNQTETLLGADRRFEGYLEIGSHGRYVDELEERFRIVGERFFVGPVAPTNSFADIVDRGQICQAGPFIPLDDYRTDFASLIPGGSIDLVTVYIGFHHCPPDLRQEFLGSIRDAMSPRGSLIVRDHDAHNEDMRRTVALAHDVFNMGTRESWDFNAAERRHFYDLKTLDAMLTTAGFRSDGRRLLQAGDPTLNTLMVYVKS